MTFGAEAYSPDVLTWLNLGVLGLLVAAAIRGLVWFKPAVERLQADLDRALADLRRIESMDREILIPAVTRATELIQRISEQRGNNGK